MPKTTQEEKYRWIKPILDQQISIKAMTLVCPFSERAIKYWLASYRKDGFDGLRNKSTKPKTQPGETPIRIKETVIELRKDTEKCAQKLHWSLQKQGIHIHARTIGKILKSEGLTRKYRSRKQIYKKPVTKLLPGELVEIDVKYVPKEVAGKQLYQFTAIDCASRWRFMKIYELQSNYESLDFLETVLRVFPHEIKAIKTDNATIFTNRYVGYQKSINPLNPRIHQFDLRCSKYGIKHYLIDPGKPAQNGRVERSHRSDQELFYNKVSYSSFQELEYKLKLWNMYYNDLEHCSLNGLSPNQFLSLKKVQNVRT